MTKDLLDKSHLAALRDALSGVDAQTSAFVLIDPSVQPDVRRRLKGQHLSSVPLELPGVATGGDADDVLPFLVRVPEQADQRDVLLKKTLAWAAEFHSATWLA